MTKTKKNKRKKWIKPRHKMITNIAAVILGPYIRWKYGVTIERFKEQGDRQYLVLMNHQTGFDQFFVGLAFSGPLYYIATEDIFSMGWISSLLRFAVEPIPIKKQTMDLKAVMTCSHVAKEGGSICLAPEGNRTFHGKTVYINPAIAKLAKMLKLPIAIFRIEGGYGVQPRWSDVVRKGKMRAYVSQVLEPEEYLTLSDEELFDIIQDGLSVDEAKADGRFYHKKAAEYLERAIYVCPYCGLSVFESHDDIIECKNCNRKIQYLPTTELKGVGFDFPYEFVADWYDAQCDFVNNLDVNEYLETTLYQDGVRLSEVIIYKRKNNICKEAIMTLYGDRIEVQGEEGQEWDFQFAEIGAVTILGKNKLNIYAKDKVYQIKGNKRFNALKYVNIYNRYMNMNKGEGNGKFLGL